MGGAELRHARGCAARRSDYLCEVEPGGRRWAPDDDRCRVGGGDLLGVHAQGQAGGGAGRLGGTSGGPRSLGLG